jgi:Flp pilus assembly protein CpaB
MTQTALSRASTVEANLGHRTPVLIASTKLPAGTVVSSDQVSVHMWPTGMVPDGAFRTFAEGATFVVSSDLAAGEPLTQLRVNAANLGLHPNEVAVTLPLPLARPPLEVGYLVKLVGVTGNAEQFLASATVLTTGRIVSFDVDALTVAVDAGVMPRLLEHSAVGVVEVVITPQRG